ncbi:heme ABC transporter substrate-binding protein IsdE [uncultured Clostridium sp.]|uniref:heme ABC transporter substrate-binding protein IsdE n=1 Tax=uncultured Clostridium sp. TaxID=59620 RepID=UPI0025D95C7D|nr:heme ABC transporter substrate-binding protein IsdE [uncultured Clostridium sp.]
MKYRKIVSLLISILMLIALVGCGSSDSKEAKNEAYGVVATSVAVTEILDALGVKVVGVPTTSYELPESTKGATEVGNPMSPDLEIIKSLNPSVVVSVDTLGSDYINLFKDNNIPSEFVSLESLDGLKDAIKTLGTRFDKNDKATELINSIEEKENKFKESDTKGADVLVLFAAPGSTMIATPKSYIGSLVEIVGGNNIVKDDKSSYVTYSKEEISKLNPKKVLVMMHAMPEQTKAALEKEFKSDTAWQSIEAIKNNNIVYLDNTYFGMSANLKVIEGLDILREIVAGE